MLVVFPLAHRRLSRDMATDTRERTDRYRNRTTDPSSASEASGGEGYDQQTLERLRQLAKLMDAAFEIPVIRRRIGLDSLIGLIPGVGDLATALVSGWIVREAMRMGVRKRVIVRMLGNIGLDAVLGAVPLVGDLFDVAYKSNSKNVKLIEGEVLNKKTKRIFEG